MTEYDNNVLELRQEVKVLRLMLLMILGVVLAAILVANLFAVSQLPRMEKIFEEMLGSKQKLPSLTRMVLSYGAMGGRMLPVLVVVAVPAVACTVFLLFRRSPWSVLLVGVALIFLMLHWLVLGVSTTMPMTQIIQGINGM